jgi:hypothetical protein
MDVLLCLLQERRMKQQREVLRKEKETAEKIAARAFAQSYLADLVPSVFGTLSDNGYFFDPVERGQLKKKKEVERKMKQKYFVDFIVMFDLCFKLFDMEYFFVFFF